MAAGDVLPIHHYIGSSATLSNPIYARGTPINLTSVLESALHYPNKTKLHLRRLTDITLKEAIQIANLAFALNNHKYPTRDYRARINKSTIEVYINNDWYCQTCFIGKTSGDVWVLHGMKEKTQSNTRAYNTAAIFTNLLKMGFDLFNAIHEGKAEQYIKQEEFDDIKLTENYNTIMSVSIQTKTPITPIDKK